LKVLLTRKKQFEGPKSRLEYPEGAAGPKRNNSRERSPASNILKALLARKEIIRGNFNRRFPRRSKHSLLEEPHSKRSAKDRVVEKLCVCSGGAKKKSTKNLEVNPIERPSECKGYIPLRLKKNFYQSLPFESKRIILPKESRHC
jgi:hypothetical protein